MPGIASRRNMARSQLPSKSLLKPLITLSIKLFMIQSSNFSLLSARKAQQFSAEGVNSEQGQECQTT
jgi:hypothetical protein